MKLSLIAAFSALFLNFSILSLSTSAAPGLPPAFESIDPYFPQDYESSRGAFRTVTDSSHYRDARRGSFTVPSSIDSDLTIDWALIPPTQEKDTLLVLVTGVHGVEAYASAALQRYFLEKTLPGLDRSHLGVLAIHAMNPFGFKYNRRVTENNVNLNRNFEIDPALFSTRNDGYVRFQGMLEPHGEVLSPFMRLLDTGGSVAKALILDGVSKSQLTQAFSQGQYHSPKGMEYGGSAFEPQVGFLTVLLKAQAVRYRKVIFYDIHTGLGDPYQLHIITGERVKENDPTLIQGILKEHPSSKEFVLTTGDEPGFYHTHGDSVDLLPAILPRSRILAVTVEFGTIGTDIPAQLIELNRMILENQGHHHGYFFSSTETDVKERFLDLFYPKDDAFWKENMIRKGSLFLEGTAKRLSEIH